jgi:hypothetical protein
MRIVLPALAFVATAAHLAAPIHLDAEVGDDELITPRVIDLDVSRLVEGDHLQPHVEDENSELGCGRADESDDDIAADCVRIPDLHPGLTDES